MNVNQKGFSATTVAVAVIIIIILFGGLAYYFTLPASQPADQPLDQVQYKTYFSQRDKYEVQIKESWTAEEDETGTTFLDESGQVQIVVIRQPDIPGRPLLPELIEDITVAGVQGTIYHDYSQTDQRYVDKVIFDVPDSEDDIYIAGLGDDFSQFIKDFQLTD
ncbi:MAG TPA: hypothetical protein VGA49_02315 [Patescibacteria group bacterium]